MSKKKPSSDDKPPPQKAKTAKRIREEIRRLDKQWQLKDPKFRELAEWFDEDLHGLGNE